MILLKIENSLRFDQRKNVSSDLLWHTVYLLCKIFRSFHCIEKTYQHFIFLFLWLQETNTILLQYWETNFGYFWYKKAFDHTAHPGFGHFVWVKLSAEQIKCKKGFIIFCQISVTNWGHGPRSRDVTNTLDW